MPSFWRLHDVCLFSLKEKIPKNHLANITPERIVKAKQKMRSNDGRTKKEQEHNSPDLYSNTFTTLLFP